MCRFLLALARREFPADKASVSHDDVNCCMTFLGLQGMVDPPRAAVEEGRTVFDNLTKIIVWTLPTNLGEGMVILAGIPLGTVLPILPIQILWINMATSVMLGLMLALEVSEPDIM